MKKKFSAVTKLIENQKTYYKKGSTRDLDFRITHLKKLKSTIIKYENEILQALKNDFHKPEFESYASEIGIVLSEISYHIKNLKKWSKPERVKTPFILFPATSHNYHEPYGIVLIIAPWNYPFQLVMNPLIGAVSAGNCAAVKTSELAHESSLIVKKIIEETFLPEYVSVFTGGIPVSTALLNERFDYIFYTGSTNVGKIVMEAAAKNLTPLTLELGGKSPCIVEKSANLEAAAKKIIWGKILNGGQSCVSPDYILVQKEIKENLIELLIEQIKKQLGDDIENNEDFCRIINDSHFTRLTRLIDRNKIIFGGKTIKNSRYIEPTILNNVTVDDPVMKEEIFGPIIPLIDFNTIDDAMETVKSLEKPLALYLYTNNIQIEKQVINGLAFGGGCINDNIIHFASNFLNFGGVGNSGMGKYHGKASYVTFTHIKGILKASSLIDINLRYPPYNRKKIDIIKKLLK